MDQLAVTMLLGDTKRYVVIVFGIAISSFLMAHQLAVYDGVMDRTTSLIHDAHPDGIWVMDRSALNLDDVAYLPAHTLLRVRGCDGVAWVSPYYKNTAIVTVPVGAHRQVILIGVDDASLVGLPEEMILGTRAALQTPDGIVVDEGGHAYLWPGQPLRLGREVEVNGCRGVLVGVCKGSPPFMSVPVVYARLTTALRFSPRPLRPYTFLLVEPAPGRVPGDVCAEIEGRTGLKAVTGREFARQTRSHYLHNTAIVFNFAIVIGLGFVVGNAVAGQTFYLFVDHHLGQFANLKAMGLTNARVARMVMVQGIAAWLVGCPIGLGLASLVLDLSGGQAPYLSGFVLRWPVTGTVATATAVIMLAAGVLSLRRVFAAEAAIVVKE